MALVPKVQWAQRADKLYITIDLQDAKDPKINISNDAEGKSGKISFSGEGRSHATGLEKHQYALDLDLYKGVNPEESKVSASDRSIFLVVIKADDAQEHWPRLLQSKGKVTNITVDWNKWVDEDEEEEGGKKDDFDMSDLQNFQNFGGGAFGGGLGGGMSGIGNVEAVQDDGDDSDDDDDDDMPPLEQEEK